MRTLSRRSLLGASAASVVIAACEPALDEGTGPGPGTPVPDEEPIAPITPSEAFYITTYDPAAVPPETWTEGWSVTFAVEGEDAATIDLAGLRAVGSEEVEHTLECIGNTSDRAISNATWTGVRLAAVLDALGIDPGDAAWMRIQCGDDYETCIPLSDLDLRTMLVWQMNGEPLLIDHGAPVRMLTPGRYGMKNPKWITRIDFVAEYVDGTWEAGGWSDAAPYKLHSWFHFPDYGDTLERAGATLQGSAFAGAVAIAKVEVSTDGGASWQEAEITYTGPYHCWTLWRLSWTPPAAGTYTLLVRATDADGVVQEDREPYDANLDGYDGLHALTVYVA